MSWPLRYHLALAISLGLLLRVLAAHFAWGPQSLDDYNHGLLPALRWSQGVPSEIPDYRNHLLVWIVGLLFKFCDSIGIDDSLVRLKLAYVGISLFSILTIVGVLLLVSSVKKTSIKVYVLYAFALNPMFAFVSSRILGESISIGFLALGAGLIHWTMSENKHWRGLAWGLFLVGLASLFRFQLGIVYLFYLGYFLFTKRYSFFRIGILVGMALTAFQGGVDLLSGKYPLQTLRAYLEINKNGATEFGVTPWYSTWALLLVFLFFPFSWAIFKNVWKKAKPYYYLIAMVLMFVGVHSMIPHKEERFLFPIFPFTLFFVLLFSFWNRKEFWVKWNHLPYFLGLNALFFFVGILSNSQESVVGPVAKYTPSQAQELVVDINPLFGNQKLREYFIHSNQKYLEFPDMGSFLQFLKDHPEEGRLRKLILMSTPQEPVEVMSELKQAVPWCQEVEKFQSMSDSLLYRMNSRTNPRRVASWRVICG